MKYKYYLSDGIDEISENRIDSTKFNNFLLELEKINLFYGYSVYIYGSYLNYLINRDAYYDINFLVLGKQMLEISELTEFLTKFHQLCKSIGMIYHLTYCSNITDSEINRNSEKVSVFNVEKTNILTLYKSIEVDSWNCEPFESLSNSKLYKGVMDENMINNILSNLRKHRKTFPAPIKIA